MPNLKTTSIVALALAALSASPANAQVDRLSPQALEAATKYGLPIAFAGYRTTCANQLSMDGYVRTNEARLEAKFADGAQGAWPEARRVLIDLASEDADGAGELLNSMPDEALRPFVDGLIENMVAGEIKPDQCTDIERGLELLDPLPVDNIAGLLGFALELDNKEKAKKRAQRAAAQERETTGQ